MSLKKIRDIRILLGFVFLGIAFSLLTTPPAPAQEDSPYRILHHDLEVDLYPPIHKIIARDKLKVHLVSTSVGIITLHLHQDLKVEKVLFNRRPLNFTSITITSAQSEETEAKIRAIKIFLPEGQPRDEVMDLEISYRGEIYDPPKESAFLRFVVPSQTTGIIGEEGVYLSAETHWYPDLPGTLATFRLVAKTPADWEAVSQGDLVSRKSDPQGVQTVWKVGRPTDALALVAGPFVVNTKKLGGVTLSTYFFKEDAHLSDEYLEASARYLETYSRLLGPYPFSKFAVVENFFASGLGFPSFTLLGSQVIKRHYVQPYSLGHEIVHCWIGNHVFNDTRQGNWVEGLTTYLANYYYDELTQGEEAAREHRRRMLVEYSTYINEDSDYPIANFQNKTTPQDNAIGYQKTAMVFHMLRRQVGDGAFFKSLRNLVRDYGGKQASWNELQAVFERSTRQDLNGFFRQWVKEKGGPLLSLENVQILKADQGYILQATIIQSPPLFDLHPPLVIESSKGRIIKILDVRKAQEQVSIPMKEKPILVQLDPDHHIFRRLHRTEMPSNLNLLLADPEKIVVYPAEEATQEKVHTELAHRIEKKEKAKVISDRQLNPEEIKTHSVFILGGPGQNRALELFKGLLPSSLELGDGFFTIAGKTYQAKENALLVSFRNPFHPDLVASIFFGLSPESAGRISPLLFFYGWDSYVVFEAGKVIEKRDFPPPAQPLTIRFEQ